MEHTSSDNTQEYTNAVAHNLENLNSVVQTITHMYKTIGTRGDTVWSKKLSLLMTTPPK